MEVTAPQRICRLSLVPRLVLPCIVVFFLVVIIRLHPTSFFGYTEDDSIYFSSAKGLAEGKGYILSSFPGTPTASKYPIFYPWILSFVWRLNPSFPSNLIGAIAISVAFGIAYIGVTFFFFRRFESLNEMEALFLTAFCAFHPLIIFYSSSILSDIPFAALALAAMVLAERATQRTSPIPAAIYCGALLGLAMLVRVFAIPVIAGILIAAIIRRAWRQSLALCGSLIPFLALFYWQTMSARRSVSPVSIADASTLGWIHTWAYYTSYLDVWKLGIPTIPILLAMLKNNAMILISSPAGYFLSPLLGGHTFAERAVVLVVTVMTLTGFLREGRKYGFRPIHFVLPVYALLILLWNYAQADRFLIPFLPLFVAGMWFEGKRILGMAGAAIIGSKPPAERVLAIGFAMIMATFVAAMIFNYVGGNRTLAGEFSKERAGLLEEKRQVYEWLSHATPPEVRVVAYEDASLYLYSGRSASRPFTFTTADFFDPLRLEEDLDHVGDVPRAIRADYWVSADDDYSFEWPEGYAKLHARMRKIEQVLPMVYRSRHGRVRVYFLGCTQSTGCPPVLENKAVVGAGG